MASLVWYDMDVNQLSAPITLTGTSKGPADYLGNGVIGICDGVNINYYQVDATSANLIAQANTRMVNHGVAFINSRLHSEYDETGVDDSVIVGSDRMWCFTE